LKWLEQILMILKSLKSGSKNRKDHARQLLLLLVEYFAV
jgi:hypothetical protein